MKKYWRISPRHIGFGLLGWLLGTNALVGLVHLTNWWPLQVLLFLCITFLPGVAILRLLRIVLRTFSAGVVYSFGLSILTLMMSGLIANQLLFLLGWQRPLELLGALVIWNVITLILIVASVITNHSPLQLQRRPFNGWRASAWWLFGASLLLPCLATLGAFRLNNGGDALLAMICLGAIASFIVGCFLLRQRIPTDLLVWLVFIIGLSILLMTAMRGWDIVGHDIEREFRVYTLTQLHGRWDISLHRDPYNACLSITILPQMFAQLLNVPGIVVFKLILQIIFAVCPAVIFIVLRQHVGKLGALAGSLLFICYPTFINDSAMLTRQGVAYLFFALALLILSNQTQKIRYKVVFLLCALGAVLSHYSTAYMFVALFVAAAGFKLVIVFLQRRRMRWRLNKPKPGYHQTVLSPLFAGILFLMVFVWYAQITSTSSGLILTLHKSISHLPQLFTDDNKSTDTATALFFAGGKSQVELYDSYLSSSKEHVPKMANALQYLPGLTHDELPVTVLGAWAYKIGINPSLTSTLRQNFAKILQVLAVGAVIYASYCLLRRRPNALNADFTCLSIVGVLMLALMVVLPVLSINYGVLRAFQQALIFLIIPIILLLARLTRRLWPWAKNTLATGGITVLFLLFSGFFAQLLGGVSPSLNLNNQGLYYGLFYATYADVKAHQWLKQNVKKGSDVRAANFNRALMHDPDYPFKRTGILPTQIGADTFIYLDPAQVAAQKLYLYYESSPLILTFPLDYYHGTRNQLYSTQTTRIYQ